MTRALHRTALAILGTLAAAAAAPLALVMLLPWRDPQGPAAAWAAVGAYAALGVGMTIVFGG